MPTRGLASLMQQMLSAPAAGSHTSVPPTAAGAAAKTPQLLSSRCLAPLFGLPGHTPLPQHRHWAPLTACRVRDCKPQRLCCRCLHRRKSALHMCWSSCHILYGRVVPSESASFQAKPALKWYFEMQANPIFQLVSAVLLRCCRWQMPQQSSPYGHGASSAAAG